MKKVTDLQVSLLTLELLEKSGIQLIDELNEFTKDELLAEFKKHSSLRHVPRSIIEIEDCLNKIDGVSFKKTKVSCH